MALNTHRFYSINNNSVAKNAEKLSSGYRVNRAADDVAGLAISEKMRAEIRGLSMASKNSQDAISMVQTAEGALQEVQNMLQRMNELAVQSATDSNENEVDRPALQQEFAQLQDEIDQVAETTTFNDMKLFSNGSSGVNGAGNQPAIPENFTAKQTFEVTSSLSIPALDLGRGLLQLTAEAIGQIKSSKLFIGGLELDLSTLNLTEDMNVWDAQDAMETAIQAQIAAHNAANAAGNADYSMFTHENRDSIIGVDSGIGCTIWLAETRLGYTPDATQEDSNFTKAATGTYLMLENDSFWTPDADPPTASRQLAMHFLMQKRIRP